MKIAYPATALDHSHPLKNRNLIGNYLIKHFVKQGVEVEVFGADEDLRKYYYKAKKLFYQIITGKNHLRHREPNLLRQLSKKIVDDINNSNSDLVFAFGSMPLAYLETTKPIYFLSDATFHNIYNFYDEYTNITSASFKNGVEIERQAFKRAKKIFLSSDWAIESAIKDYGVPENKLELVPLGANIDYAPDESEINKILQEKKFNGINLLMIAKYWHRKGCDRAVNLVNQLNKNGMKAKLTVIGTKPEGKISLDFVHIIPFLDKSNPFELKNFEQILKDTHFLLFPSRAETFGHVICEANAYAIPVLASNIGGIPSAIKENVNGFLIDFENNPEKALQLIIDYYNNQVNYFQLAKSSYNEYQTRLNWDYVVKKILASINL